MNEKPPPPTVLLTYAWCRTAYAALRSLTQQNIQCVTAGESSIGMCQQSRFSQGHFLHENPYQDEIAFIQQLNEIVEKSGAGFLLPGHDETEVIAKHRYQLPEKLIVPIADYDQLQWANDKARVMESCQALGLSCPQTLAYDPNRPLSEYPLPCVVKLRRGNGAKGVYYASTYDELKRIAQKCVNDYELKPGRYPIIQEQVPGEGWGVSFLYWRGEALAHFTHRRLREKTLTGGTSTARISASNDRLVDIAKRLLDCANWHGLAMVEFKYDPDTQRGWAIEINPRLWGSIALAVRAGVDFPYWLYLASTQGPQAVRPLVVSQQQGVLSRWYIGELIYALQQLMRRRPSKAGRALWPFPLAELEDVPLDDPGAFCGESIYYLKQFVVSASLNPEQRGMVG